MIYDFPVPYSTDTKHIRKVFADPKYIPKENLEKIDQISMRRKETKDTMKMVKNLKPAENLPDQIVRSIIYYAQLATDLDELFTHNYEVKKNIKWTPILSSVKLLKFSKGKDSAYSGDIYPPCYCTDTCIMIKRLGPMSFLIYRELASSLPHIKFAKSGEIIMALYAAFLCQLRAANADTYAICKHFGYSENEHVMTQSALVASRIEQSIKAALKVYTEAWHYLKHASEKISASYQTLTFYDPVYIESQGIFMDILLSCTQMNINVMQIELLRRQSKFQEMGGYAKTVESLCRKISDYVKPFTQIVNPEFIQYLAINRRLYKAIALWSLFQPYLGKLKIDRYETGETVNTIGTACSSMANEITGLHAEIQGLPNIKTSAYYVPVMNYFDTVILPQTIEISKVYGQVYKNSVYDDAYFTKIEEKDYLRISSDGQADK